MELLLQQFILQWRGKKKTLGETALTKRPNLAAYATLISYSVPQNHASQLCIGENHSTSKSMISSEQVMISEQELQKLVISFQIKTAKLIILFKFKRSSCMKNCRSTVPFPIQNMIQVILHLLCCKTPYLHPKL